MTLVFALVNVMVSNEEFLTMLQEHLLLLARQLKIRTKQIIKLTAEKNALFIYLHAINALNNILGQP